MLDPMLETKLYTIEDLLEMEGDYELDRGVLVEVTQPTWIHGAVCGKVGRVLGNWTDRTGAGVVMTNDTGFVLERNPDTMRGPDVAFVCRERVAEQGLEGWGEGAPELAVEVLSPSNRPGDLLRKIGAYLAAGASLVWVIDPGRRCVVVYRPDGSVTILGADQEIDGEDILPGFRVRVSEFFEV